MTPPRPLRIALVAREPGHPLLAGALRLLERDGHLTAGQDEPADVVLLKARDARSLRRAEAYERAGVPVLNSAAVTARCQDRDWMERTARAAGLPFAPTLGGGVLAALAWPGPVVVKSRYSRKDDLVARAGTAAQWHALAQAWPDEPVLLQRPVAGDGWDRKVWVVGGQVFAEQRRSELEPGGPERRPWAPDPQERRIALSAGAAFGLQVYGVDLLPGPDGPVAVDVNAFPGVRLQPGAPEALAALVLRTAGR
ncbi:ATP-grasp domain-containing protein [Kitasatospora cineracea]|uniref:Ribosomal protein S6--L-glutamate ligase n=1 Tax=Kitasatospora cineracea TaxID=88074 RepID=A0A3N4S702_9ACTN|nr:ribosomal protein S6--L-glutamate ligase [Kitasatospora cineracea]